MKRFLGFLLGAMPVCSACHSTADQKPAAETIATLPVSAFDRLFPLPREALSIPDPQAVQKRTSWPMLGKLVAEMERITSVRFIIASDVQLILDRTAVGNLQPIDIPPERVWTVFETLLIEHDFCLSFVSTELPIMLNLTSTEPRSGRGSGDSPRARALHVPVEDLGAWSAHPAFAIATIVTLNDISVRDLANSMRQIFTEPQTQQVIPMGDANSLMITGFGPHVAGLVRVLRSIDAEERERHEKEDKLKEERNTAATRTGVTPRQ